MMRNTYDPLVVVVLEFVEEELLMLNSLLWARMELLLLTSTKLIRKPEPSTQFPLGGLTMANPDESPPGASATNCDGWKFSICCEKKT